jgi:hypothetical protein
MTERVQYIVVVAVNASWYAGLLLGILIHLALMPHEVSSPVTSTPGLIQVIQQPPVTLWKTQPPALVVPVTTRPPATSTTPVSTTSATPMRTSSSVITTPSSVAPTTTNTSQSTTTESSSPTPVTTVASSSATSTP